MAAQRYYWLKLKEDFFRQKTMKKLRTMEHGEIYAIIYLKMQLESLRNNGIITFEGVGDSFPEELAFQIDEREDDVRITVDFLLKHGLLIQLSETENFLPQAEENTGSETSSAKRMRELRGREASQCADDASHHASQCDAREKRKERREKREDKREKKREGPPAAAAPTPIAEPQPSDYGFGPELTAAFSDWLTYKREKKQGYKPTGLKSLVTQVRKNAEQYGEAAVVDLMRLCMSNGWQGIIWDKLHDRKKADHVRAASDYEGGDDFFT